MLRIGALFGLLLCVPCRGAVEPTPARESGVRGQARLSPVRPVSRPGEENSRPLPGAVIAIEVSGGGKEIARARTDREGRFRIALPPGKYRLVPRPLEPGKTLPRGIPQDVEVTAGRFLEVTARYDSGIR